MILKIAPYKEQKRELLRSVEKYGIDSISQFCACTGLPVAAACVFVKEDLPQFADEMDRKIEVLKEFYGYKSIEE